MTAYPLLQTSNAFASATASGADWREVGRKILEMLESIRTEGDGMNVGFLYTTAALAPDLTSLLSLLKNVTRISAWYGATGQGICGSGQSFAGMPAAVAMIGKLPEGGFCGFTLPEGDAAPLPDNVRAWSAGHTPVAALTHGILCAQGAHRLKSFRERDGFYAIGGFSAAASGGAHICEGNVVRGGDPLSGLLVDGGVRIMSATSFGCAHAGPAGRITKCNGNVIETIEDVPACDFLHDAIDALDMDGEDSRKGHVHAAFPIPGSDHKNFLMRNITEIDEASGAITIAHQFERGDAIQFVYRDRVTATTDLTQTLTGLYGRAADEVGAANLQPKAILYFGCGARIPDGGDNDEAKLIQHVFSGVPMAGFYTAAEICNGHVYGYTGVIVLLL